jgi:hypothetical protein
MMGQVERDIWNPQRLCFDFQNEIAQSLFNHPVCDRIQPCLHFFGNGAAAEGGKMA